MLAKEAKTIFTSGMDPDGFIACRMYNNKNGFGAELQAQFTAPLIYFDDIPLYVWYIILVLSLHFSQVRYYRASVKGDVIIVSCPLDTTGFWFCTAIVESNEQKEIAILSPCTEPVTVQAAVKHVIMDNEFVPSCEFRIKLDSICRPFQRDFHYVFGFDTDLRVLKPTDDIVISVGTQEMRTNKTVNLTFFKKAAQFEKISASCSPVANLRLIDWRSSWSFGRTSTPGLSAWGRGMLWRCASICETSDSP